ncbi:hypothetical protein [Streptomyces sp. NPDC048436]|uniref:hypothetical protein n=1 Tax=Streptomyces sp. NPDC048436 TaxID=3365550 RepID=UPI00372096C8
MIATSDDPRIQLARHALGTDQTVPDTQLSPRSENGTLDWHADILDPSRMDSTVCHLDYQTRNWLVGDVFGACGFERMRRDSRVRDFARLEFRR